LIRFYFGLYYPVFRIYCQNCIKIAVNLDSDDYRSRNTQISCVEGKINRGNKKKLDLPFGFIINAKMNIKLKTNQYIIYNDLLQIDLPQRRGVFPPHPFLFP
jgi:hypothetical protein